MQPTSLRLTLMVVQAKCQIAGRANTTNPMDLGKQTEKGQSFAPIDLRAVDAIVAGHAAALSTRRDLTLAPRKET